MGAGGWNKGLTKDNSEIIQKITKSNTGKKRTQEQIDALKNRSKEIYKKPQAIEYTGTELCEYGCANVARYIFKAGKLCCSVSHNSCPKKRENFSKLDHTERTEKSLKTRIDTGVTKSSQVKATKTRKENGHYENLAVKMQEHWKNNPHNNLGPRSEWVMYKDTNIAYQGSYELHFLENLENIHDIEWVKLNVKRGPAIWYIDPTTTTKRLYISDYIIHNTIYEIKSSYTWNRKNKDLDLEKKNRAKLNECVTQGYNVVLVLDKKEVLYATVVDGAL